MDVRAWLASRTPEPPPALRARLDALLGEALDRPVTAFPEEAVSRAERLVRAMLAEGRTGRDAALDLLAADALVTYAFEAAADTAATEPALLAGRARAALDTLA
jgi:hypothetical protein